MLLKLYLDKRKNKHEEAPIRVVWSFNGDRYQTTMGFSIPTEAWDNPECRVTPAAYNHKNTASNTINAFIVAMERAVNRLENYARTQNATLTKPLVKQVVADVIAAGGEYPFEKEKAWNDASPKPAILSTSREANTNSSDSAKTPRPWRMLSCIKLFMGPDKYGCGRMTSSSAR